MGPGHSAAALSASRYPDKNERTDEQTDATQQQSNRKIPRIKGTPPPPPHPFGFLFFLQHDIYRKTKFATAWW